MIAPIEIVSIELTNRCSKGCSFCYNRSGPEGATVWSVTEAAALLGDCAANGVKAVSYGGGEPLEFPGLFDLIAAMRGRIFQSMTTNGLHLTPAVAERLAAAGLAKLHVSIHFPEREAEVDRAIERVAFCRAAGLRSGVNLLVARPNLEAAARAAARLRAAGIGNDAIMYLPMRMADTPLPAEVHRVAGEAPFQSMSCLGGCAASPRFASIDWMKRAAWCSYTVSRRALAGLTHRDLTGALDGLDLQFCGGTPT